MRHHRLISYWMAASFFPVSSARFQCHTGAFRFWRWGRARDKKLIKADGLTEMLFYYRTRHGIRPYVLYKIPPGERMVIRAFYEHERERISAALQKNKNLLPIVDIMDLVK